MNLLFKLACASRKTLSLIGISIVSMCLLTFASQMEMLSIGILAQKGPSFFELFGPLKNGTLEEGSAISKEEVEKRWETIDTDHKNSISKDDAAKFLETVNRKGLVDRVFKWINEFFPVNDNVLYLAILFTFVGIFKATTLFWHRFTTKLVAIRVSRDLRQRYFEHIQALPMDFYQKHPIGSLSSRVVTDAFAIAEGINAALTNYLQTPFTVVTTLVLCFMTSWQLSLMVFVGLPLIIYPIAFLAKKVKKVAKQLQKNQESFSSVLIDFLAGIQTVKVFAMEEFSLKKYREHNDRMATLEKKSAKYDVSSRPIVHTIAMFFLSGALLYGMHVLYMGVSEVLVYCGFLYVFYEPLRKFAETNALIQRGIAATERMMEVLSIEPQLQDLPNAIEFKTFNDQIEFKDVWFKYKDDWILKGVNFTVPKGKCVAIVGPTGAGKSTIVQLLPRLYEIEKGEIRIDGQSLATYSRRSLREMIAFVPQRPFLFLDTVAENIAFGRPFPRERVESAAKNAYAEEFILNLPQKYDTELAEGGKNLSGGQQQRLAIARALVKEAPILIMDEATSSLDAVSENRIKSAMQQLRGKMTQIIIAHRLSTIEDADKIIYMEKGQKIAEGTRDELLKICPQFRIMWELMHISH